MTIDLKTGTNYPPRREDYCTKIAGTGAPGGDCPKWKAFLATVTNGNLELQKYLQRVAGYCLTGLVKEHALFFLYGTGANGKSVFLNTLRGIWGDYAVVAPMEILIATQFDRHPTELADLRGARLVIAHETERGRYWNESKLKALTGGDPIKARFMRQDFFEFDPKFKLMIAGNHKPSLRDVNEAIRRRIHLIPFKVTIPEKDRDPDLFDKLKAEWRGILQWAVDGCVTWQKTGLEPPEVVRAASEEYFNEQDAIGQWITDRLDVRKDATASSSRLYANWVTWAEAAGERPGSQKSFTTALKERGFETERTRDGIIFVGLGFRAAKKEEIQRDLGLGDLDRRSDEP